MSDFTFPCPLCQQDILCGEQYRGQQFQCPICQGEITAPAKSGGSLGIKTPSGAKHAPVLPGHRQRVVPKKKSSAGKVAMGATAVVLVLVILFFVARYTGLDSHLPGFLGRRTPATAEANAAGVAPGQAATTNAETAAVPAPPTPPVPVVWTTNLAEVVIPTNAANGKITAMEFKYDSARVDNGILFLRQGTNPAPDMELGVLFGLKPGETLAGKTIEVAPEARVAPRVWKKWKVAGKVALQTKVYSKGYAMKLQFGEVSEDKVTGKIFLALTDEEQSVVAGIFVASVGSAAVVQPTAAPATPAASQMSEEMRKRYGVRGPARP